MTNNRKEQGIPFVTASGIVWLLALFMEMIPASRDEKSLLVFCVMSLLLPIAWGMACCFRSGFSRGDTRWDGFRLLILLTQISYVIVTTWVLVGHPENLSGTFAMFHGVLLMPYAWKYRSRILAGTGAIILGLVLLASMQASPLLLPALMVMAQGGAALRLVLDRRCQGTASHVTQFSLLKGGSREQSILRT